ncbi:hypothetical protein EGW08_016904 [Elysia chlorotica]|uniref:Cyclin-dependent kinase inhibitor domain-containing protein n=1 Tax=Elysia chlorotica TaxID=188477 RepID=A0A3S0ZBX0_ELYCH|nr:hypothetical protein EGW08_016904 [Elysia chlorotica]
MSTAVRCLFSISDNDRKKLNQDLDEQCRKIDQEETERFKQRWGFDPVKGSAVEGSGFEYTLLDRRTMPAMYTSSYRRRPSRPHFVLQARSPARRNISLSSAPVKRKLRFDDDNESGSNDENQDISSNIGVGMPSKQAKMDDLSDISLSEVVSSTASSVFNPLSSPPSSPPASSLLLSNSPRSPQMLSSSCPPALESDFEVDEQVVCSMSVPGLSRSLSESSIVQLSPDSQAKEFSTPTSNSSPKPVKLVQREITDYVRIKKHSGSLKASPRS